MSAIKYNESISILRSIRNELNKSVKRKNGNNNGSIDYIIDLFRENQATEKRLCRPLDHYRYFAQTYLTYLKSSRLQEELTNKYFHKGENSVEKSARMVGLALPKQPQIRAPMPCSHYHRSVITIDEMRSLSPPNYPQETERQ